MKEYIESFFIFRLKLVAENMVLGPWGTISCICVLIWIFLFWLSFAPQALFFKVK